MIHYWIIHFCIGYEDKLTKQVEMLYTEMPVILGYFLLTLTSQKTCFLPHGVRFSPSQQPFAHPPPAGSGRKLEK